MTNNNRQFLKVLRVLFYFMAVLSLLFGVLCIIGAVSSAASVTHSLIGLDVLGLQLFSNMISNMVSSVLTVAGIVLLMITIFIGLLFFAAGQLITTSLNLDEQVATQAQQIKSLIAQLETKITFPEQIGDH